jgi:hypothetical protein
VRIVRIAGSAIAALMCLLLAACGGTSVGTSGPVPPSGPSDTTAPTVTITGPTGSGSFSTTSTTVALSGSASDNVGVVSVSWSNQANGASGSAVGTTSWSVPAVTLAQGVNQIVVTARDAAGNAGAANLSVTSNLGGTISLSGNVDSSLINRGSATNTVYLYQGTVTPTSTTTPFQTAPVTQDNGACTFSYQLLSLPNNTYTVALSSDATNFKGVATVTLPATATHDFAAAQLKQVGPTRAFITPSAAISVASPGDVIEIDPGNYVDDNAVISANSLTLRGVGGVRPHLSSTQPIGNGKGIWVNDAKNTTVENIEFSGANVTDQNGAGIRNEADGLIVCHSYFHDNENGLLGGVGTVLIEYSEFDNNGFGDGFTHNIYIDGGNLFTLRYSYSHRANVGHTVKSRAKENHILYNRIMDEDGATSYEIDLPNGGLSFIIGNLIEQGANTGNSTIITYGEEGVPADGRTNEIYVVNNTVVNDLGSGAFVALSGSPTARLVNNIFAGRGNTPVGIPTGAGVTSTTNLFSNSAGLANSAGFDYHLTAGSPAINAGTNPGATPGSVSLVPTSQYVHPTSREDRPVNGAIDIGAYEF